MHGVGSVFMDELFSLVWKELLAKSKKISTIVYKALKLIKALGLNYDSIHACLHRCVFFTNTLTSSQVCSKCSDNIFMDGS